MIRRRKRLFLSFTLLVIMVFLAGCGMVRVNPEVDNKTVVAKVAGRDNKRRINKIFGII